MTETTETGRDVAQSLLAMSLEEAVAHARQSHLSWAEYIEAGNSPTATFTMDAAQERAWVDIYDRLTASLAAQQRMGQRLKTVERALRRVEWQAIVDPTTNEVLGHLCLWCSRKPHTPDCERQTALDWLGSFRQASELAGNG